MVIICLLVSISTLYSISTKAATVTTLFGGSWEIGTIWDSGSSPTATDDVVITTGNNVTLTSNVTVASLMVSSEDLTVFTINSGYTLTVTGNVTIYGSPDATSSQIACNGNIIIGGDLIFEGDASNAQAQISMGDGSSATLSGNIVFNGFGRVWAGSTAHVHTFTFNGSGNRDIRFTGNRFRNLVFNTGGNINMQNNLTATTVYGNVEVVSGSLLNNGFSITGNSGRSLTIRSGAGLQLSGTTGLPSTFTMVVESGSTVSYTGASQTVGALTYSHLQISGTGTKTLASNTTVTGNLTISSSTLDVHSTNNYSLNIAGNFNNSGTFNARAGSVTFNGSSAQTITSGTATFYNVTFNNSNLNGLTLTDNMTVTNVATFTDGVVNTGVNRLNIESTSASAVTGHSSASFVNGRLRRFITTNTSTYAFPVGNSVAANGYHLAELVNNNLNGVSYIDARFGALTNHYDGDLSTSDSYMTYLSVAPNGVWHITPNAQPSSGSYDIRLSTLNMGTLADNQFGILKRNDGSTSAGDWGSPGTMNADNGAGRMVADGYALRMGLSSFSEFGIGRASTNGNPLPIELVSFTAQVNGNNQVMLNWLTAIEINNEYFTVERSADGINFTEVARVEGAGNSTVSKNYTTLDAAPANGINYYRLKQTDFDGAFEYSDLINVVVGESAPTAEITVYPNPANTGQPVQVSISGSDADFTIEVYEIGSGKLIHRTTSASQSNLLSMPEGLAAGAYLVRVSNDLETQNHKLFVR